MLGATTLAHTTITTLLCCNFLPKLWHDTAACCSSVDVCVSVLQVSAQWIMGAEVKLPPVTIPEGLSEDSKYTLRILSQMVVDCTQFEAQK